MPLTAVATFWWRMAAFMLIMLHINSAAARRREREREWEGDGERSSREGRELRRGSAAWSSSCLCTQRMFTRVLLLLLLVLLLCPLVAVVEASYLSMAMAELGRFINLAAALTLTRSTHFRPRQAGQGNRPSIRATTANNNNNSGCNCNGNNLQHWGKRKSQLGNLNDDNEK